MRHPYIAIFTCYSLLSFELASQISFDITAQGLLDRYQLNWICRPNILDNVWLILKYYCILYKKSFVMNYSVNKIVKCAI